jgi:hypothetical protein
MSEPFDWVKFWDECGEDVEDVEGLIFRKSSGTWVAVFVTPDNRQIECAIDFNPFTGERLT